MIVGPSWMFAKFSCSKKQKVFVPSFRKPWAPRAARAVLQIAFVMTLSSTRPFDNVSC